MRDARRAERIGPTPSARISWKALSGALVALALLAAAQAPPAGAFDTGAHFDMTRDALTAEGFSGDAAQVAQVNNYFIDLYENFKKNSYSGHSEGIPQRVARWIFGHENWPRRVYESSDRSHFDGTGAGWPNTIQLSDNAALEREWDRLRRAVYAISRQAAAEHDRLKLLTVLGASLHEVQDFYTHSVWVEPCTWRDKRVGSGPGWLAKGQGEVPTWFDVPPDLRRQQTLYTAGAKDAPRGHGNWKSDSNSDLATSMNKDWPGRPCFTEAYSAAYFASRQWVQAVRQWVGNDSFWAAARGYRATGSAGSELRHDQAGATSMSFYSGHWQGQGEPATADAPGPGGSLDDLLLVTIRYFRAPRIGIGGKTRFRRKWETVIPRMASSDYFDTSRPLGPVPSSRPIQQATQFVRMELFRMVEKGIGDPTSIDRADFYARAGIAGQGFLSGFIHGRDSFSFPPPHFPFTFMKSVPRTASYPEPLTSLRVEVKTSNASYAGTDDDVFVRINGGERYKLDKPAYDDFERGDRDTYSIPIDAITAAPRLGDIRYLQIEKSRDGLAGGWKLGGVKLFGNDRLLYSKAAIETWLEDSHRTWRAPGFTGFNPSGQRLPVWVALYDDDSFLYGSDDHGDLFIDYHRRNFGLSYLPPNLATIRTQGGDRYGGRIFGDGDRALIDFRVFTVRKVPPPDPARAPQPAPPVQPPGSQPPPPGAKPDLAITYLDGVKFTVSNVGQAAAGPFVVTVRDRGTFSFSGLAAGASESREFACVNDATATADAANQVDESNEDNNTAAVASVCIV